MINKNIVNCLIMGILLILGATFVSAIANVTISAPVASNHSAGDVTITAAFDGNETDSNVTWVNISIYNGSSDHIYEDVFTGQNLTTATRTWDADNGTFLDGNYTINITVNDSKDSLMNSSTVYFYIDNTLPVVSLHEPANNYWSTNANVSYFNFTSLDNNLTNCSLWGSWSGSWLINQTNSTVLNNTVTAFKDVTLGSSTSAGYGWNIRCRDLANNMGSNSASYFLGVDLVNPVSVISATNEAGGSILMTKEANYAEDININCGATDPASGLNATRNTIAVKFPGVSYYQNLTGFTSNSLELKGIIDEVGTSYEGRFLVKCRVFDNVGKTNVTLFNFTTKAGIIKTNDEEHQKNITRFSNSQNAVKGKDLVAL